MTSSSIKLFVLGTGWGVPFPTSAPFPLKLGTWMRMHDLDFEWVVENNPGKGPKGKSPWIEDGEVRFPVHEVTIAGNLLDLYQRIVALGDDQDIRGGIRCGSLLIEEMTIAGA